ncbi:hypothetical protein ACTFIU_006176 [Dictyostelium citrinum]
MSNKEEEKEKFSEQYIENAKTQINKLFFDRIGGLIGFSDQDNIDDTNNKLNLNYQEREECEDDQAMTTNQTVNVYSTICINNSINKTFTIKDNETIIINNEEGEEEKDDIEDKDNDDEKEYQRIKIEYIKISKRYFELKEKRIIKKRNKNNE